MAEKGVIYLTYAGRNLLAKAMTGQGVHFTRVAVGDGSTSNTMLKTFRLQNAN